MTQETFEQTFEVTAPARLKLSNIRGRVTVQPGESGVIHVRAVKHLADGDAENTQIEMHQEADGEVIVETRVPQTTWNLFRSWKPCKVDYQVTVPVDCKVNISSVDANVEIQGVQDDLACRTVSGQISLQNIRGKMKLNSVSGDMRGNSLSGDLTLESVSGDVKFQESNFPSLNAKTVSGDLALSTPLGEGPYNIHTVSGDARFLIPAPVPCTVKMNTISGSIRTSLPVTTRSSGKGHKTVTILGGGLEILLSSVSGDIHLDLEEGVAPEPQKTDATEQPAPQNTPASATDILNRLEQGEISVDEALQALRSA